MMNSVTTRELRIDDYDAVVALWNSVDEIEVAEGDAKEEIAVYLKRNPGLSRVAEDPDGIMGTVLCGHDGRRGLIHHLAVAPRSRGQGIGQRLVAECVAGLRRAGLKRALIFVAQDNAAARSFWLRNNWEDVSGARLMGLDL
jgi:ribosomal protein S18 acetylase RimI-like enzyme